MRRDLCGDRGQWEKAQALYALGFRFSGYRRGGPSKLTARTRDIPEFVALHPNHPQRTAARDDGLLPASLVGRV